MTTCETLAPLLVSRPLGLLEPEREALVSEHLPGCGSCPGFAREVERALAAASLPAVEAGDPSEDPPGWAELSARIRADRAGRPSPRRWLPAMGLLLVGSLVGAAALWPSPPAPPAPPPQVAPAAPPPSEVAPPPSEPPAPPLEPAPPFRDIDGTVITAEGTDPVRVLLSVGSDDEVRVGDRFEITRGGVIVGEVEVEIVKRDSCHGRQVSVREGFTIEACDGATLAH